MNHSDNTSVGLGLLRDRIAKAIGDAVLGDWSDVTASDLADVALAVIHAAAPLADVEHLARVAAELERERDEAVVLLGRVRSLALMGGQSDGHIRRQIIGALEGGGDVANCRTCAEHGYTCPADGPPAWHDAQEQI